MPSLEWAETKRTQAKLSIFAVFSQCSTNDSSFTLPSGLLVPHREPVSLFFPSQNIAFSYIFSCSRPHPSCLGINPNSWPLAAVWLLKLPSPGWNGMIRENVRRRLCYLQVACTQTAWFTGTDIPVRKNWRCVWSAQIPVGLSWLCPVVMWLW